mmetsp:Transcript_16464/g.21823  ORF Transcript_16464/g.21823 Transcript_16464/m.21823 type:complete len:438 (-) Transcript_16464:222-1535(-)
MSASTQNDTTSMATETSIEEESSSLLSTLLEACKSGDINKVRQILIDDEKPSSSLSSPSNDNRINNFSIATQQEESTGISPLMAASQSGNAELCQLLIDYGAPWNAIDRHGKCAGNYAVDAQKWEIVNLLVEVGTRAELILGATIRAQMKLQGGAADDDDHEDTSTTKTYKKAKMTTTKPSEATSSSVPAEQEPCTKPDYLTRNVRFNEEGTALLDDDDDAVMMEWERPIMDAHASILLPSNDNQDTQEQQQLRRVLNIGFGMGIIDTALQERNPTKHVIIEAHPQVYAKMLSDKWNEQPNVEIFFGKWQTEVPKLISRGYKFDGIFYDTYGEHFTDLEDFHELAVKDLLDQPNGIYSFFNGLAPDNLFFHGVACQCVKLQLAKLGLDTEFAQCQIQQINEQDWKDVRRKYWYNREIYYLPIATWNKEFLVSSASSS